MRPLALLFVVAAAPAVADEDAMTEVARGHFHAGNALYNAGQYQGAIHEFEEARQAKPLPAFDYNIAQCYDRLGQPAKAIEEYQRYLAHTPPPADAEQIAVRIRALQATLPVKPEPPPPSHPGRGKKVAGLVVGISGLGLVAGGIACAVLADQAADDLSALSPRMQPYDPALAQRMELNRTLAGVFIGLGAAEVVTGVVLYALGHRDARRATLNYVSLSW